MLTVTKNDVSGKSITKTNCSMGAMNVQVWTLNINNSLIYTSMEDKKNKGQPPGALHWEKDNISK